MTGPPITRRRFLGVALVAAGASAAGAAAWIARSTGRATTGVATTSLAVVPSSSTVTTTPATTSPPLAPGTATTFQPSTTTAGPELVAIQVLCRDAWGAVPAVGEFTPHTIEHITVHHTAVVLASNTDAPARARQHQEYHQSLGWPDLAYHYLIDAKGNVYEGRPTQFVGDTATNYDPAGHFLVCCEGDFNQQEIGADQYQALVQLVAWGVAEFGVDPGSVQGHRDLATTSCPGDNLYPSIANGALAEDVNAVGSGFRLQSVCGDPGAELVAAIVAGTA